jgi:hypothetical protein
VAIRIRRESKRVLNYLYVCSYACGIIVRSILAPKYNYLANKINNIRAITELVISCVKAKLVGKRSYYSVVITSVIKYKVAYVIGCNTVGCKCKSNNLSKPLACIGTSKL